MRYSCFHCKKTPEKPYEKVFERFKHYSSNVKNDSVDKYLNHMSSYSAVKNDVNKEYVKLAERRIKGFLLEFNAPKLFELEPQKTR